MTTSLRPRRHRSTGTGLPAILVLLVTCGLTVPPAAAQQLTRPERQPVDVVRGTGGVVVSETPLASAVGRDMLRRGGNAVDAAVAVAFALQVTWPEAGNIGGGGFMIVAPPSGEVECINYREKAPAAADRDSFLTWKNRRHARMAGVPGTVRGLAMAHERYGKLPWSTLIAPSIRLANEGFPVNQHLAYSLNRVLRLKSVRTDDRYREFRRVYGHSDGRLWTPGERLTQPDLAQTLRLIAQEGDDVFYEGIIAEQIAAEMKRGDGLITLRDLKNYTADRQSAIATTIGPHTIYGGGPPSSGGIIVGMQLRMLQALDLKPDPQAPWTVDQVHLMVEVMKRAFRERAAHLGDPQYVSIPKFLTTDGHAAELASTIDRQRATPGEDLANGIPLSLGPPESMETTHFSIIDANGMAVSNTYTLEGTFGSRIVVPGAGFLLNNEMGDFNWVPGLTNEAGRIGTDANLIAPGKRMLSSQSPTIVKTNGKVSLIVGSPGGRTIINTVTQILTQVLLLDRSLESAIDGPRLHHQWFPDEIRLESHDREIFSPMAAELQRRGHRVTQPVGWQQGSAHGIAIDPKTGLVTGVADWRRGGAAAVVRPTPQPSPPGR